MSDLAVDDDTLAAVRKVWAEESKYLPALVDRLPGAGALRSTRDQPLTLPYAHLACESAGKATHYVKSIRKDVRKVTITAYGTYEQAVAVQRAILALFNARLGYRNDGKTLAYPSGAQFIKWWPTDDGTLVKGDEVREGQEVWRCVVTAEVYSTRTEA